MKVQIIGQGVYHGGKMLEMDEEIEIDDISGAALKESGHAVEVTPVPEEDEGEEGTGTDRGSEQEEELRKTRKALDNQYKRDELYEAAVAAGVEVAFDAKKADIIEAVILQKKAGILLK